MVKNLLKTTFRIFWKEKGYSLLNILGLTVGITASMMLLLYVQSEKSIDHFHKDIDRIFQVMEHQNYTSSVNTTTANPGPLKDAFKAEMPEVEYMAQFTWPQERLFMFGDNSFKETGRVASEDFFHIFDVDFVEGSAENSLTEPTLVYISEDLKQRMFGDDRAVGKTVTINDWGEHQVAGVFENVNPNSTMQFNFVMPYEPWAKDNTWLEDWGNNGIRDLVKLHEGVDPKAFNAKIRNYIKEIDEGSVVELFIQNFGDTYLRGSFRDGKQVGGRITYVRLFTIVAIFILTIACINFMNLATARSSKRSKEVGVKKVVGSSRRFLVTQFLAESVIMAMISALLAGLAIMLLIPGLNSFIGRSMEFSLLDPQNLLTLIGIALGVGLLAGSYPAFFLSSFAPIHVLKGTFKTSGWSNGIRKGLVVFQFLISTFLIMGTLVVQQQIDYVKNKNLGFNKDNVIYIPIEGDLQQKSTADLFTARILDNPDFLNVTKTSAPPIYLSSSTTGGFRWDGKDPENKTLFQILQVGHDFVETFNMEMKEGRAFDKQLATDTMNVIINEQAAAAMHMEDPLNFPVTFWGRQGKVVGIVKDFHFSSLRGKIEPLVVSLRPQSTFYFFMKIRGDRTDASLTYLETVLKDVNPRYPFEYEFLDESYDDLYQSETTIGTLSNYFAGIAIFISLLGLFGLASFAAEQRIKEIGIRKVLGAGLGNLILLMTKGFLLLVLLGFGIAAPLVYFFMDDWLSRFEYRIDIGVMVYAIAGISAVLIALLTVSYHSLRAAHANPVKSLRYE